MEQTHNGSATETLDKIRTGGTNLLLTAQARIAELKRALDNGRFTEAFTVATSLQEKCGHLAAAQSALGRLSSASIIRVADLEPGMHVLDAGVLKEIGPCDNCEREECDNVALTFENGHKVTLDCDDELAVGQGGD